MYDLTRILPPRPARGYLLTEDDNRVVIATTAKSKNAKTGDMIQTWILARHISPIEAVQSGADALVCGDCKLRGQRGFHDRTCYVNVIQAPTAIWRAYHRGSYPRLTLTQYPDVFHGRTVRFGAYGDPVFIPVPILRTIAFLARRWSGYTHQWQRAQYQNLRHTLMASVDTQAEYLQAKAMGWRTFRLRRPGETLNPREIICPASEEMGRRTTCARCGLCNGERLDGRADIAIQPHGVNAPRLIQIA